MNVMTVALVITSLVGCSSVQNAEDRKLILGSWTRSDETKEVTFFADGKVCGWEDLRYTGRGPRVFNFDGFWRIDGNGLAMCTGLGATNFGCDDPQLYHIEKVSQGWLTMRSEKRVISVFRRNQDSINMAGCLHRTRDGTPVTGASR